MHQCVCQFRERACFSLNVSSESAYLLKSECHRMSVCLHQCLCQFRDSASLFQSECKSLKKTRW